jgi:hypothetical protein
VLRVASTTSKWVSTNTQYKTLKILQDPGTDVPLGRGARVFKVKKVDDPDDTSYVLKDLWLEKDQMPEHEIYEAYYRMSDVYTLRRTLTPSNNTS